MAWKRGTTNQQGGGIRLGHIAAFLLPTSEELSVSGDFHVLPTPADDAYSNTSVAYVSPEGVAGTALAAFVDPATQTIHLHAHAHPSSVMLARLCPRVAPGCIYLSDSLRINSKLCTFSRYPLTAYSGDVYSLDARNGIVGDTRLHHATRPPPVLRGLRLHIRPRCAEPSDGHAPAVVSAQSVSTQLALDLQGVIASLGDVYLVRGEGGCELCCRVVLLEAEAEAGGEGGAGDGEDQPVDDEEVDDEEIYRGIVSPATLVIVERDPGACHELMSLTHLPRYVPLAGRRRDVVDVWTSDNEMFPVRRSLLRPCLRLTYVVQRGYGLYKTKPASHTGGPEAGEGPEPGAPERDSVRVDVDCCTFDRVLLYLQHAERHADRPFVFDPLLAADLLQAGERLQVQGLVDAASRVLGSFQERVRPGYISLETVRARNAAGTAALAAGEKRSETWILMDGMVLDISRWLEEHPGGSSIIPEHALDRDCTGLFEVYHASRQSFAYLREFYIGELHPADATRVPCAEAPSAMFLQHLALVTPWRIKKEDMQEAPAFKSF